MDRRKRAVVYRQPSSFMVCALDETVDGIPVVGEITVLPVPVPTAELGREVLKAARRGRENIPVLDAEAWSANMARFLAHAGKGSWRAFMRSAQEVTLWQTPEGWVLTRQVNEGPSIGFGSGEGEERLPDSAVPETVGRAVERLLKA